MISDDNGNPTYVFFAYISAKYDFQLQLIDNTVICLADKQIYNAYHKQMQRIVDVKSPFEHLV